MRCFWITTNYPANNHSTFRHCRYICIHLCLRGNDPLLLDSLQEWRSESNFMPFQTTNYSCLVNSWSLPLTNENVTGYQKGINWRIMSFIAATNWVFGSMPVCSLCVFHMSESFKSQLNLNSSGILESIVESQGQMLIFTLIRSLMVCHFAVYNFTFY